MRKPARKPCRWCVKRWARPAVWRTRWPKVVWIEDYFGGGEEEWFPPKNILLCDFHVRHAIRYEGVKAYRFRKLT